MPQQAPFRVNLDLALSGKGAPPRAAYDQALAKSAAALDWLRQQHASKGLELLGVPARADDLRAASKQAATLKGFSTIAVLGIGGSSLGGQDRRARNLRRRASIRRAAADHHGQARGII